MHSRAASGYAEGKEKSHILDREGYCYPAA